MSPTEGLSVIGRVYNRDLLRFAVFPNHSSDFPEEAHLERLSSQLLPGRWIEEGLLCCQKDRIRFLYDPTTGNFRVAQKKREILTGSLQTGQFGSPLFFVDLAKQDRIYALGAASAALEKNNQTFYLLGQGVASSFPFFFIRHASKACTGIYWNSTLAAQVMIAHEEGEKWKRGIYIRPFAKALERHALLPMAQDFFVFTGTPSGILQNLYAICGKPFFPPLWSLGCHQKTRSVYSNEKEVWRMAKRLPKANILCDAIHLDRGYMHNSRTFTWHPKAFPRPAALLLKLRSLGLRIVTAVSPEVPADPSFSIYRSGERAGYFCKNSEQKTYIGSSKVAFPDFSLLKVQQWWSKLHKTLFEVGVSGIWNNMNEARLREHSDPLEEDLFHDNARLPHAKLGALYAKLQAQSAFKAFEREHPERLRPWVLSRSGFCGIQKYAALWTQMRHSSWDNLREHLYAALNLNLSAVPYCGADIGDMFCGSALAKAAAFLKSPKKRELFVRWVELASLMSFFRIHGSLLFQKQRPWGLGSKFSEMCAKHIRRRYQFLPYLYTLAYRIHKEGLTWLRPLFYEFPDLDTDIAQDQFLIGSELLAAPVLEAKLRRRRVYLPHPQEAWYEYETGTLYQGGTSHFFLTQPGYYPLFIRAGAIIPLCFPQVNAELSLEGVLILEIYPSERMLGRLFIDDTKSRQYMEGAYSYFEFRAKMNQEHTISLSVKALHQASKNPFEEIEFRLPARYCYLKRFGEKIRAQTPSLEEEGRSARLGSFRVPFATGFYSLHTA